MLSLMAKTIDGEDPFTDFKIPAIGLSPDNPALKFVTLPFAGTHRSRAIFHHGDPRLHAEPFFDVLVSCDRNVSDHREILLNQIAHLVIMPSRSNDWRSYWTVSQVALPGQALEIARLDTEWRSSTIELGSQTIPSLELRQESIVGFKVSLPEYELWGLSFQFSMPQIRLHLIQSWGPYIAGTREVLPDPYDPIPLRDRVEMLQPGELGGVSTDVPRITS